MKMRIYMSLHIKCSHQGFTSVHKWRKWFKHCCKLHDGKWNKPERKKIFWLHNFKLYSTKVYFTTQTISNLIKFNSNLHLIHGKIKFLTKLSHACTREWKRDFSNQKRLCVLNAFWQIVKELPHAYGAIQITKSHSPPPLAYHPKKKVSLTMQSGLFRILISWDSVVNLNHCLEMKIQWNHMENEAYGKRNSEKCLNEYLKW